MPYTVDKRRRCPACGKSMIEAFFQASPNPKRSKWYVHCSNPSCDAHKDTLSADEFQKRFTEGEQDGSEA